MNNLSVMNTYQLQTGGPHCFTDKIPTVVVDFQTETGDLKHYRDMKQ